MSMEQEPIANALYHLRRAKKAEESASYFFALHEYQEARTWIKVEETKHKLVPLTCTRIST